LQEITEEAVFEDRVYKGIAPLDLMAEYARAFLQDVNYYEIAQHLLKNYAEELKS
jgi:hypothetical protein